MGDIVVKQCAADLLGVSLALFGIVAGCAGHPEQAAPAAGQPAVAPAATAKGPATRQVPVTLANVAEVQRAGYKIVNKDGQKLYCRTDPITGSRVQTHTQCLTEQELYDQINETQNLMSLTKHENPLGPK
jgi:hypothetical protein